MAARAAGDGGSAQTESRRQAISIEESTASNQSTGVQPHPTSP